MLSRLNPPQRRAALFLVSIWLAAVMFVIARAVIPG